MINNNMESDSDLEKADVLLSIRDISQSEESLLAFAKGAIKDSVENFVDHKIGKMFGVAAVYKQAFERLQIWTKDEMDRKIRSHFRHPGVREAYDDWHESEQEWDKLLKDVDLHLDGQRSQPLTQGQMAPLDIPLVDARSGETTSLQDLLNPDTLVDEDPQSFRAGENTSSPNSSAAAPEKLRELSTFVLVLLRHFA